MGQAKLRLIQRERGISMGVLVTITQPRQAEVLWEFFCASEKFGYVVKGRRDCRTAEAIEDKLREATVFYGPVISVKCNKCNEVLSLDDGSMANKWALPELRTLAPVVPVEGKVPTENEPRVPVSIFFENEEFTMLQAQAEVCVPSQNRRKDANKLLDILDDAKANWSGSEVELRARLNQAA